MSRVYRIVREAFSADPLDGEGSFRFGGRWSSAGTRVVYAAEHLSLAMVEYFVHIDSEDPPKDLILVSIEIPDTLSRLRIDIDSLPSDWRGAPPPGEIARIGDGFAARVTEALLWVPSAVVRGEFNVMINPAHREFKQVRVADTERFTYDPRFYERRPKGGTRSRALRTRAV